MEEGGQGGQPSDQNSSFEVDLDIEKGRREVGGGETGAAQPRCGAPLLAAVGDPAQPGAARARVLECRHIFL